MTIYISKKTRIAPKLTNIKRMDSTMQKIHSVDYYRKNFNFSITKRNLNTIITDIIFKFENSNVVFTLLPNQQLMIDLECLHRNNSCCVICNKNFWDIPLPHTNEPMPFYVALNELKIFTLSDAWKSDENTVFTLTKSNTVLTLTNTETNLAFSINIRYGIFLHVSANDYNLIQELTINQVARFIVPYRVFQQNIIQYFRMRSKKNSMIKFAYCKDGIATISSNGDILFNQNMYCMYETSENWWNYKLKYIIHSYAASDVEHLIQFDEYQDEYSVIVLHIMENSVIFEYTINNISYIFKFDIPKRKRKRKRKETLV